LNKSENPEPYKLTEFETYAHYLSLTTLERDQTYGGHTDQFFCKKYKVSAQTLSDWSDNPKLWQLRNKCLFPKLKKVTPDILRALELGAKKHLKASEVDLWLQKVEGWLTKIQIEDTTPPDTQKITITADDILEMIPNEKLRKRIRMKLLQKKYQDRLPG
jgi:hypothetical protein